jgi:hypothetical protein
MGVRISWLMFARNSLLARIACSSRIKASFSPGNINGSTADSQVMPILKLRPAVNPMSPDGAIG